LSRVSKSPIVIISDWGNILMIVCCGGDFRCVVVVCRVEEVMV